MRKDLRKLDYNWLRLTIAFQCAEEQTNKRSKEVSISNVRQIEMELNTEVICVSIRIGCYWKTPDMQKYQQISWWTHNSEENAVLAWNCMELSLFSQNQLKNYQHGDTPLVLVKCSLQGKIWILRKRTEIRSNNKKCVANREGRAWMKIPPSNGRFNHRAF